MFQIAELPYSFYCPSNTYNRSDLLTHPTVQKVPECSQGNLYQGRHCMWFSFVSKHGLLLRSMGSKLVMSGRTPNIQERTIMVIFVM